MWTRAELERMISIACLDWVGAACNGFFPAQATKSRASSMQWSEHMCPGITETPSLLASLHTRASFRAWIVLGICVVLCLAAVAYGRWGPRFPEGNVRSTIYSCTVFLGFGLGFFIVLGLADPWYLQLLHWYESNGDSLRSHGCSLSELMSRYAHLQSEQKMLEGLGFSIVVGAFLVVFVMNKWHMWKVGRRDHAGQVRSRL